VYDDDDVSYAALHTADSSFPQRLPARPPAGPRRRASLPGPLARRDPARPRSRCCA
jgi:hypothetical protein